MLAQREKILALVAGSLVGLLIFVRFVASPYLESWHATSGAIEEARLELQVAADISTRKADILKQWKQAAAKAQVSSVGDREAEFLSFLKSQARSCGFHFPSLAPRRGRDKKGGYTESAFDLKFSSSLSPPVQFLANLHSGMELARVIGMTVNSSPGSTGSSLEVNLTLSTVALEQEPSGDGKSNNLGKSVGNPDAETKRANIVLASSALPDVAPAHSPETAAAPLGEYRIIIERNIFSPNPPRKEPEPVIEEPEDSEPPVPAGPPLVLTGVLKLKGRWVAIVEGKDAGDRQVLSVTEQLAGWTLKEIHLGGIAIVRGKERREIKVGQLLSGRRAHFGSEQPSTYGSSTTPSLSSATTEPPTSPDQRSRIERLRARRMSAMGSRSR